MLVILFFQACAVIFTVFPGIANLHALQILIIATVFLSTVIAIIPNISSFILNKDISSSFDVFMYSFLGGLIGRFIGIIVALPSRFIVYLIIPSDGGFIYSDINKIFGYIITIFLCWLIGILVGGIKTIKH